MRLPPSRILAALAVLVLVGAACGSDTKSSEAFTSTEGGFSAEFPETPEEDIQTASAAGLELEVHLFTAETDDYAISVGYVDYPEEFKSLDPKAILSGVAQGAAGNIEGDVTKNNPTTFQGLDAIDYEVSADELDFLVDTASNFSGVYGARMTGGGFGGCTVNLVAPNRVDVFKQHIAEAYKRKFSIEPQFYDCIPAQGAGEVE